MLTAVSSLLPPLAYLAVCSAVISSLMRNQPSQKQRNWKLTFGIITALFAVKYAYEVQTDSENFYKALSIPRHCSYMRIRQAYKKMSVKLHPDKNLRPNASAEFQRLNEIYEVLSDEKLRDVYNRFGENMLQWDPRNDEFSFIINLFTDALLWALVSFVVTIPRGSKGCRTWIILCMLAAIAVSGVFQLSEAEVPDFSAYDPGSHLSHLTEHDFVLAAQRLIPYVLIVLVILSEYFYVDADLVTASVLENVMKSQKEMVSALQDIHEAFGHPGADGSGNFDRKEVTKRVVHLKAKIVENNVLISDSVDSLKQKTGSVGEAYHWIVFVLIFGGAYFLSNS